MTGRALLDYRSAGEAKNQARPSAERKTHIRRVRSLGPHGSALA